jgi:hypothetical protein
MKDHLRWSNLASVLVALCAIGVALAVGGLHERAERGRGLLARPLPPQEYEQWARSEFYRRHPGEKPLNWRLAEAAVRMHDLRPMGKFVLSVTPGKWGNDCSDFVDCIADEALGARARCLRHSPDHLIGTDSRYFEHVPWDGNAPVLPGDLVEVRHSPWYEPNPQAPWHVGMLGPDDMVYDFEKLVSWPEPRYGRSPFTWFVRFSPGSGEVVLGRLRPQYRYRIDDIPIPRQPSNPAP